MRILTIDLEDWFHLLDWPGGDRPETWKRLESRIETATEDILQRLDAHDVRATFFCLGWVARHHRSLVRRIHDLGHEIASHGDQHRMLSTMSPGEAREDLKRATGELGEIVGAPVRAYRAPGFSLGPRTLWVLDILISLGIQCDSSVFPAVHPHGGYRAAMRTPGWIVWSGGRLREFPVTPATLGSFAMPFSGGGFFRTLPYAISRRLFSRSPYCVAYFHPRDFDVDQPRAKGLGPIRRVRSYAGVRTAGRRFGRLLAEFEFESMKAASDRIDWGSAPCMRVDVGTASHGRNGRIACGATG